MLLHSQRRPQCLQQTIRTATCAKKSQHARLASTNPSRNKWTEQEIEQARKLWDEGYDTRYVAEHLNRPLSGVERKLYDVKNPQNAHSRGTKWTASEIEQARKLRSGGLTIAQISAQLGRSYSGVSSQLRKRRVTDGDVLKQQRLWTSQESKTAQQLLHKGMSYEEIAERIGRTPGSTRSYLRRHTTYSTSSWTDDEDQQMLSLRREGLTDLQIAERLPGRTRGDVLRRLKGPPFNRHKALTHRNYARWSSEEDAKLLEMRREGLTFQEISKRLDNRSVKAVDGRVYALAAAGSPRSMGSRWTQEELHSVLQLHSEGFSTKEIAKRLGTHSAASVASKIHRTHWRRSLFRPAAAEQRRSYTTSYCSRYTLVSSRSLSSTSSFLRSALISPVSSRVQLIHTYDKRYTPNEIKEALLLLDSGLSYARTAERLGLNIHTLRNKFPGYGARKFWTAQDIEQGKVLRQEGLGVREIAERLGKSVTTTRVRFATHSAAKPYTPEEDQRIRELRDRGMSWTAIAGVLKGRTSDGLKNRWSQILGKGKVRRYSSKKWTINDLEQLRHLRRDLGLTFDEIRARTGWKSTDRALFTQLGRVEGGVKRGPVWNADDDSKLLELKEKGLTYEEIARNFPGRTPSGIVSRLHRLRHHHHRGSDGHHRPRRPSGR